MRGSPTPRSSPTPRGSTPEPIVTPKQKPRRRSSREVDEEAGSGSSRRLSKPRPAVPAAAVGNYWRDEPPVAVSPAPVPPAATPAAESERRRSSTPSIPRLSLDSARLSASSSERARPPITGGLLAAAPSSGNAPLDRKFATWRSDALATVGSRDGGASEVSELVQALALGSGALAGLRSARFTPTTTPRLETATAHGARPTLTCAQVMHSVNASLPSPSLLRNPQWGDDVSAAAAALEGAAVVGEAEVEGEEEHGGPGCGEFCAFAFRGPSLPRGGGGGGGGSGSDGEGAGEDGDEGGGPASNAAPALCFPLQRSFFAQCELLRLPGGEPACWPPTTTPPDHLRYE